MFFSVVIPVYNMEKHIGNTVRNLLNQTYKDYEIILVDDGSKDNSGAICDRLSQDSKRIKVIHTDNQGSGPARNVGIENSTGDYIYFPDADDIVENNALEKLAKVLDSSDVDLIVFGYNCINDQGEIIKTKRYQSQLFYGEDVRKDYYDFCSMDSKFGIQGAPWNKLFSMKLISEKAIRFPALRRHQDTAFISRYVTFAQTIRFIPDVLYSYYENDLTREWDKYPKDYIDCVIGLRKCNMDTILSWNPDDKKTHDYVDLGYISGVIKSLELSFSKKFNFNKKERLNWMKDVVEKSDIKNFSIPSSYNMKYQKTILSYIKNGEYNKCYYFLKQKVFIQKHFSGLFIILKKLLWKSNV